MDNLPTGTKHISTVIDEIYQNLQTINMPEIITPDLQKSLSETERKIFEYVNAYVGYVSPTQIGMYLGKKYNNASAFASRHCLKLVEKGLLARFNGKYKAK